MYCCLFIVIYHLLDLIYSLVNYNDLELEIEKKKFISDKIYDKMNKIDKKNLDTLYSQLTSPDLKVGQLKRRKKSKKSKKTKKKKNKK